MTGTTAERLFAETVMPHLDDALTLARWLTGNATDAQDVVQEACLRAFKALERGAVENPRAWLLAITRNAAFTWLARNRPKSLVLTADPDMEETTFAGERPETPEEAVIAATDVHRMEEAMAALPQAYRETIVMREINGLAYRDIAELTGVPIGTVMSRLARARNLLIAALAEPRLESKS
ncbi:sigma-70 family RNA polymerase sigma factor [Methyloferula stellata]|uniref:sigma-70 family RNA polymerase sigma factor n=1 Tax=Methyloferula stellata TaxID=876270 RepID=UPI00047990EA|nr:sigma-70 family RNA polymerase sigma factor [Methyloferula stellata]